MPTNERVYCHDTNIDPQGFVIIYEGYFVYLARFVLFF